jgi:hypothetical protein
MKRALAILTFAGFLAVAAHAGPVFTVIPFGGIVVGTAGGTVGWGFTLTDDNPAEFLGVTGSSFTPLSPLGTFEDYISSGPNLIVVDQSDPLTQLFDPILRTGVGAFHIIGTAPSLQIHGILSINYSLFSVSPNDPNFDPGNDLLLADGTLTQAVSVDVVPEPASWLLVGAAFLPVALLKRRWQS